jgi:cell division protease FtsH
MAMGGRIAEDIFIGSITTGASNDIEKATEVARAMVCEYGMSELGPLTFGKKEEQIFLGREISQHRDYSEDTAIKIDQEVQKIVNEQYKRAETILKDNKDVLIRLAEALLEYETLDAVQIRRVVAGLPLEGTTPSNTDGEGSRQSAQSEDPSNISILPIPGNDPVTA